MNTKTASKQTAPKAVEQTPEDILNSVLQQVLRDSADKDVLLRRNNSANDIGLKHEGVEIILPAEPTPMSIQKGIETLYDIQAAQEADVSVNETIRGVHYLDGLVAFSQAMEDVFGFTKAVKIPGFFGSTPPQTMDINLDLGERIRVTYGRFEIPNMQGYIETSFDYVEGIPVLRLTAETIRRFQPLVERVADRTREIAQERSIFKSKAFEPKFVERSGQLIISHEQPRYIDVRFPVKPIFSQHTEDAIQASIYNPIEHSERCRELGIPLKRGVLLEGPYGTGKTLVSQNAANKALDNGWTFIRLQEAEHLAAAISFARRFQPAVLFLEDLDEAAAGENRDAKINSILNTLDGVDSKSAEVMVVFTSNNADSINQAMMRPGRLDAIIRIDAPDAEASVRLMKVYAGDMLDEKADYSSVGESLAGNSAAVIREVVERAKLYALSRTESGGSITLTPDDLNASALTMKRQLELLAGKEPNDVHPMDLVITRIAEEVSNSTVKPTVDQVTTYIRDNV